MAVQRGFKTHDQITREYGGGDWHDNIEQLKIENQLLRDAGVTDEPESTEPDVNDGGEQNEQE